MRMLLEHNPVGESQSNLLIENGVRMLEGLVRTLRFDLEEKILGGTSAREHANRATTGKRSAKQMAPPSKAQGH